MTASRERAWQLRALTVADFDGLVAMADARADKLKSPTRSTRDGWQKWMAVRGANLESDNRVAVDGTGRIVGFADVDRPIAPFVMTYVGASVHPDRWDCEELWDALYAWTATRAASYVELAPAGAQVSLLTESVDSDHTRKAAVTRAGFELARIFFRMRIEFDGEPKPPRIPAAVVLRRINMERELLDIALAHTEAFRDHWGHAEQSPESFVEEWRQDTVGQRPDFSHVAVVDGVIAGYVLCEDNYRGDRAVGLASYLGVRPMYRRGGVALALLETAFRAFHAAGYHAVRLGVDASSPTGALRLYEKAGMHVVEQVNRYEKILRPGKDWLHRPAG